MTDRGRCHGSTLAARLCHRDSRVSLIWLHFFSLSLLEPVKLSSISWECQFMVGNSLGVKLVIFKAKILTVLRPLYINKICTADEKAVLILELAMILQLEKYHSVMSVFNSSAVCEVPSFFAFFPLTLSCSGFFEIRPSYSLKRVQRIVVILL